MKMNLKPFKETNKYVRAIFFHIIFPLKFKFAIEYSCRFQLFEIGTVYLQCKYN